MPYITLPEGAKITPEIAPPPPEGTTPIKEGPSPVAPLHRAGMGIKMTPEGKVSYLENFYGRGNVVTDPEGNIYVKPRDENAFYRADPAGFDLGDIAEVGAPMAVEGAPMLAAGTNPLTVGGAAALGAGARQGLSALLPGQDNMSLLERGAHIGTAGALGGGFQGAANLVGAGINAIPEIPRAIGGIATHMMGNKVLESLNTPVGREGMRIQIGQGFQFSVGQQTGDRQLLKLEGVLRQHPWSADRVFQFDQGQLRKSVTRLNEIAARISPDNLGPIGAGTQVRVAFNDVLDKAMSLRAKQAEMDFKLVDESAGGAPTIGTDHLLATALRMVKEYDIPGGGDESAAIVARLKDKIIPAFTDPSGEGVATMMTGSQAQRLLSIYSSAAAGTTRIFDNISTAADRRIARKLVQALDQDVEYAATRGNDAVAASLKTARDNYRTNSAQIDQMSQTVLGKMFNNDPAKAPEKVAEVVMKMRPSEVVELFNTLDRASPTAGDAVRRYFLQRAIDQAIPPPSAQAIGGVRFSPAKFLKAMPDDATMTAIFGGHEAVADLRDIVAGISRIPDQAGMAGSQTGQFGVFMSAIKNALTPSPTHFAELAGTLILPDQLAQAMMTNQGRQALRTVMQPIPGTGPVPRKVMAAMSYLTSLAAEDTARNAAAGNEPNVRPMGVPQQ